MSYQDSNARHGLTDRVGDDSILVQVTDGVLKRQQLPGLLRYRPTEEIVPRLDDELRQVGGAASTRASVWA